MFSEDSVSAELVARAVARGELPAGQAPRLARLVHEVVEAQVFRQMAAGGEFDRSFARHVVDDIVLPVLAAAAGPAGRKKRTADTRRSRSMASLRAFDQPELERFTRVFEKLFDAADPESMTSYYTEQAQLMADGITPIRGHDAIGQFWRAAIGRAHAAGAQRTIQLHESRTSGDLGYALCTVTVEIPGGLRRASFDTTVWQRDPGGNWRIAVDISTPLPS